MSEKILRNIFLIGTLIFMGILGWMAADTLRQVRTVRTPALTPLVIAGKETWQKQNCNDCHTILGIGGYFAPELTKVVDRRTTAYLTSFLTDPQAAKPGTTMPNQMLSIDQVNQIIAFFGWVAKIDTNGWPPKPLVSIGGAAPAGQQGGLVPQGQQLFSDRGCTACHMVNGLGASGPGPDLSKIGSQVYDALPNDAAFLTKWLQDPSAQKPGTTMPQMGLSTADIDALVAYMTSLK